MASQDPTKARLLESAGEEFAEKGFAGATVRSICRKAGANVAAVNYHFGDKEQLYIQAVIEAHRCGMEPIPEGFWERGTPAERLRAFIRNFLTNVLAVDRFRSWHHALMLRELIRPTSACEALVREFIRPKFEGLKGILREIVPGADDRRLNATCFSIIGQCLHYRVARPVAERLIGKEGLAELDLDYLTEHIAGFTLAALGLAAPLVEADRADSGPELEGRGFAHDAFVEAHGRGGEG
jgi:AcrR family transcriptional regulator